MNRDELRAEDSPCLKRRLSERAVVLSFFLTLNTSVSTNPISPSHNGGPGGTTSYPQSFAGTEVSSRRRFRTREKGCSSSAAGQDVEKVWFAVCIVLRDVRELLNRPQVHHLTVPSSQVLLLRCSGYSSLVNEAEKHDGGARSTRVRPAIQGTLFVRIVGCSVSLRLVAVVIGLGTASFSILTRCSLCSRDYMQ